MKFSVIIPAHNEARFLPYCLSALAKAQKAHRAEAEIIVALNRCTDETKQIAIARGAKVVEEDRRNLSAIRNAGARAATGDVLVTVDADSVVAENLFVEIERALKTGRYVGGGVRIRPERLSLGIGLTWALLAVALFFTRLSGGVYWCRREDFNAIGGFNEALPFAEDLDFAKRLRTFGRKSRRRFTELRRTHIVTSCRKFDRFGDWFFLKIVLLQGRAVLRGLKSGSTEFQDRFFYDFNNVDH